jgi:YidC/Oxa1 family membrane protein insertase
MSGFLGVPVGAAYHLVFALTHLLAPVAGGLAAAGAIVLFTAVIRLLISPLSFRALRGQAAMTRLAPQIQALRTRYGRQPERFNRELTALYKRERTSPFAGILPLLAQWPFLSVMYLLFRSATVNGAQNQLLSDGLFGVPLGAHWLSGAGLLGVHGMIFLVIFAILAALCWLSARLAKRAAPAAAVPAADTPAKRREGRVAAHPARAGQSRRTGGAPAARTGPDPAEALASSKAVGFLTRVLPYVTVVIAAFAPLAAAIYLLTTVAWTLAERRVFLYRTAHTAGVPVPETRLPAVQRAQELEDGLVHVVRVGHIRGVRRALDGDKRDRTAQAVPDHLRSRQGDRGVRRPVHDQRGTPDLGEAASYVVPVHQAPERPL